LGSVRYHNRVITLNDKQHPATAHKEMMRP
jgi:hypothetical protein